MPSLRKALKLVTRPIPFPFGTAQLAIMAVMFMGCTPIYLLGLDHDWLAHRGQETHFYSGTSLENHRTAGGSELFLRYRNGSAVEVVERVPKVKIVCRNA